MRSGRHLSALPLLLPLLASPPISSATPTSAKPAPQARSAPAFNLEATNLPPGFKGTDIPSFFKALAIPSQGEFESSEAYAKRVETLRAKDRPPVAFVLRKEDIARLDYETEAGEFVFLVAAEHPEANGQSAPEKSVVRIQLASAKSVGRTYAASNAFGAKTTITEIRQLDFAALVSTSEIARPHFVNVRVPVAAHEAPSLKPRLRLLLACRPTLAPERIVPRYRRLEPTFQNPVEGAASDMLIACDAAAFWAFDERTGRVLTKAPLEPERNTPGPKE